MYIRMRASHEVLSSGILMQVGGPRDLANQTKRSSKERDSVLLRVRREHVHTQAVTSGWIRAQTREVCHVHRMAVPHPGDSVSQGHLAISSDHHGCPTCSRTAAGNKRLEAEGCYHAQDSPLTTQNNPAPSVPSACVIRTRWGSTGKSKGVGVYKGVGRTRNSMNRRLTFPVCPLSVNPNFKTTSG